MSVALGQEPSWLAGAYQLGPARYAAETNDPKSPETSQQKYLSLAHVPCLSEPAGAVFCGFSLGPTSPHSLGHNLGHNVLAEEKKELGS